MTCPDCTAATVRPWDGYAAGCLGCVARGVSRSRIAAERRVYGQDSRYRRLLECNGLSDEQVQEAARVDFEQLNDSPPPKPPTRSRLAEAIGIGPC